MEPFIRQMVLCEDVQPRAGQPGKIDIFGLLNIVRHPGVFPFHLMFTVYLVMSGGRGSGRAQIVVIDAESEEAIYTGQPHPITFTDTREAKDSLCSL